MTHIYAMTKALRETGNLSPRLVEIAVVAASHANRCAYCVAHHATILAELGLDAENIETLNGGDAPGLSDEERLVRDYALAVTERSWGIRDAMHERLEAHFSHTQIVELTMRIALTGMFNKINQALGIEMEDGLMADFMAQGLNADSLPEEAITAAPNAAE